MVNRVDLEDVVRLVADGGVVVLSGAGLSTESGIPDYRGPSGARRQGAPMTYKEFTSAPAARQRYWARSHVGWRHVARARPNRGHRAVAALQRGGMVTHTITQNVDGLHQAAGSSSVNDLHGRLDTVVCLNCDNRRSRVELSLRLDVLNPAFAAAGVTVAPDGDAEINLGAIAGFRVADCRVCGGVLKPDVVFFGESVPRHRVDAAMQAVDDARVLLVLGSSLTVMSGYRFVIRARRAGTPVVIINRGPTRGDDDATLKLDVALGEVLPDLVQRVDAHR